MIINDVSFVNWYYSTLIRKNTKYPSASPSRRADNFLTDPVAFMAAAVYSFMTISSANFETILTATCFTAKPTALSTDYIMLINTQVHLIYRAISVPDALVHINWHIKIIN